MTRSQVAPDLHALLPQGYAGRPARMSDIESVVDVENRRSMHDIGEGDMTIDRLSMFWEEPGRDISDVTQVVEDPEGQVVACADFYEEPPFASYELALVADPDHAAIGIEEWLIAWGIARARASISKAPKGATITVHTQVWASNVDMQQRVRAAGFTVDRVWNRMVIVMDEQPAPVHAPGGISIRTLRPHEVDSVHAAWEDAQRDEYGFTSLTPQQFRYFFIEQEQNFDPTLWFLAIDDQTGEIAGYCLCRWERPGEPSSGQVRYLAVRRPYRRRGIADALLRTAFGEIFRRGKARVGLLVDATSLTGADRLYERAGMQMVHQGLDYRLVIREGDARD